MDEHLKARLIGATVLVVIAVALVPELLSGPKQVATPAASTSEAGNGKRTIIIDLTNRSAGIPTATLPVPAPATQAAQSLPDTNVEDSAAEPAPATSTPPPRTDDVVPAPAAAASRPQASASAPPQPSPATSKPTSTAVAPPVATAGAKPAAASTPASVHVKDGFAVQVGAFGSSATARKLVSDLKDAGYPAYLAPLDKGGKTLNRVRVGPTPDRAVADKLAAKLKARGLPASVVPAG